MKGGTSTLMGILKKCHATVRNRSFECHYFDGKINKQLKANFTQGDYRAMSDGEACRVRADYIGSKYSAAEIAAAQKREHPDPAFVFEKTPAYVRTPHLPEVLHRLYSGQPGGIKIVVLFRDPVKRLHSDFRFINTLKKRPRPFLPKAFDDSVQLETEHLRDIGMSCAPTLNEYKEARAKNENIPDSAFEPCTVGLSREEMYRRRYGIKLLHPLRHKRWDRNMVWHSMYSIQLEEWLRYFEYGKHLHVVHFEELQTDKMTALDKVYRFLGLPGDCYKELEGEDLDKDFIRHPEGFDGVEQQMSNITEEYLTRFYRPYNDQLADMLGEEWRGIWEAKA